MPRAPNCNAPFLLPQGQISPAKLAQSMDYGAVVCEIEGNFDDCMRLISELADEPSIYIANSINPFRIEGQKTVAFELLEQCDWRVPDHVVVPGGNMGNSSALGKGFDEMLRLGLNRSPAKNQRRSSRRLGAARAFVRQPETIRNLCGRSASSRNRASLRIRAHSPPPSKLALPFPGRKLCAPSCARTAASSPSPNRKSPTPKP